MSIRHYDHRHETVQQVRECTRHGRQYTPQVVNQTNRTTPMRDHRYPATDKAVIYLLDLIAKRESASARPPVT